MNFKALKQHFIEQIAGTYDAEEASSIFYIAAEKISNRNRSQVILNQTEEVKALELEQYTAVINDLIAGKPIQHILEEAYFFGLHFTVNSDVLIPRVETEELISWILDEVSSSSKLTLLDVGTGSGCIAITLKKHLTEATVYALDISKPALAIAKKNALANGAALQFVSSSIFDYQTHVKFDLIVSNPPYIKEDEMQAMQSIVLDHEPHQALFVSNENPLLFYNTIADFAIIHLTEGGHLFFEINEYLGPETVKMLRIKGLKNIILRKDMQGKNRMIYCRK